MAIAVVTVDFADSDEETASWSLASSNPKIIGYGVTITDGDGPVGINFKNVTSSGATVEATGEFTGSVDITVSD